MLIFTGTHDEEDDADDEVVDEDEDVDDEDKHETTFLLLDKTLVISFGSMFKWFISSAEYLWQNEWFLCKRWVLWSESWSVKSFELALQIMFISFEFTIWFGVTDEEDDDEHAEEDDECEHVDEDLLRTFCTSWRIRPWLLLLELMLLLLLPPDMFAEFPLKDFLFLFFLEKIYV